MAKHFRNCVMTDCPQSCSPVTSQILSYCRWYRQGSVWRFSPCTGGPNNPHAASQVAEARKEYGKNLVASGAGASFQLMSALERGDHVGLLVDQKFRRGIKIPFFGKDAKTNPLLAKLARRYDCPVHGARTIRLPDGRFRLEITDELVLPRDKNGDVDIRGTTELVTKVVEDWVREYPEQWLWMHRRWG